MAIAGIVMEAWKKPIFSKHLEKAGYDWVEAPGITEDSITLQVHFELSDGRYLQAILGRAQKECLELLLQNPSPSLH